MKNVPVVLFTMVTSLVCAGCATVRTADNAHRGSPKIYGGTRLNVAALTSNADALASYKHYGVEAPEYPGFDLPLSLVGDTLMLPFSVWYTITEPVVGRQ